MRCFAFTAASFSYCLFLGLSALIFVFSLFSVFWLIIHLHCEVTSSVNTSGLVPLAATNAHAIALPPPCLTDDVDFASWTISFLLHTFLLPSFWYRLILVHFYKAYCSKTGKAFSDVFYQSLSLSSVLQCFQWFAFCRIPSVLRSIKASLDCRLWQWCQWVVIHQGMNSTIIHLSCVGLLGLLVLMSSPVHFLFLRMYQVVDLATLQFLLSFWEICFFSLMMTSFTCIKIQPFLYTYFVMA